MISISPAPPTSARSKRISVSCPAGSPPTNSLAASQIRRTCAGPSRHAASPVDEAAIRQALAEALGRMKVKEAATMIAELYRLPRREVYQMALTLHRDDRPE